MSLYRRKVRTRQPLKDEGAAARNECGKVAYPSRKAARRMANAVHPDDRMRPYRCDNCGLIHIGHLPRLVRRGHVSMDEYYAHEPASFRALPVRQRHILDAVRAYLDVYGYAPTIREIGEAVGMPTSDEVLGRLDALERQGWIRREPGKTRAIVIVRPWSVAA